MWEVVGFNPPDPSLYLAVYPPILLPNLSNTQNQIFIQQPFAYVIISDIPYKKSCDPFILRCLDLQEVDIVLHMAHNGISRGLSSCLILAIDSKQILRSYGQLWIQRLSANNTSNKFVISIHQQYL